jgi:tetratricopeptide (TPR) repeat protein
LVFIPFVHAQSLAPTQATTAATPTAAAASAPVATPTPVSNEKRTFGENFNLGTKSYQEKRYDEAVQYFKNALELEPESAAVLTDLGLTYYQLQKKGLAIAYFRKALFIDPSLPTASAALKFALSQLEVKEIPHQIEAYEKLRSNVLNSISLGALHLLTALFLFTSGFLWLRFWGRRRKALDTDEAPPPIPAIGILLALGFLASLTLTLLKIYDLSIPRATIIADKVNAQMAPGDGQNSLFELYAGFEVLLNNTAPGWTQVSYPGGLTGWVKNDSLMLTSGQNAF